MKEPRASPRCPVVTSTTSPRSTLPTPSPRTGRCAPRRRSPGPRRTAATWSCPTTSRLRGGPRRRRVLLGPRAARRRRARHRHPQGAGPPAHPGRAGPARSRIPQDPQPGHHAGRGRRLRPRIAALTTWFVDQVIEAGECDLASVIGVPAVVTLDWLGTPLRVAALRRRAARRAGRPAGQRRAHRGGRGAPAVDHRADPGPSPPAPPTAGRPDQPPRQEVDGRPIGDDEAYSMVELLISGGVGTTGSLVSQALVHLSAHPDQRRADGRPGAAGTGGRGVPTRVLADPGAGPHGHPGHRVSGLPDEEGRPGAAGLGPANRDPAPFEDPDDVDIRRWPNRHTAFGIGDAPLRRRAPRARDGPRAHRPGDPPDAGLRGRRRRPGGLPVQGVNAGWQRIPGPSRPGRDSVGPRLAR